MNDFKSWLRETLHRRGLTQVEFAERSKVTQPAVQKWLTGRSTPSHRSIARLAAVLDVPATEVYAHLDQTPSLKDLPPDIRLILVQVLQLPPDIRDEVLAFAMMQVERERKRARPPAVQE